MISISHCATLNAGSCVDICRCNQVHLCGFVYFCIGTNSVWHSQDLEKALWFVVSALG